MLSSPNRLPLIAFLPAHCRYRHPASPGQLSPPLDHVPIHPLLRSSPPRAMSSSLCSTSLLCSLYSIMLARSTPALLTLCFAQNATHHQSHYRQRLLPVKDTLRCVWQVFQSSLVAFTTCYRHVVGTGRSTKRPVQSEPGVYATCCIPSGWEMAAVMASTEGS